VQPGEVAGRQAGTNWLMLLYAFQEHEPVALVVYGKIADSETGCRSLEGILILAFGLDRITLF
jgi:hypothetical protein